MAISGHSGPTLRMSALPPKADIIEGGALRLLMTLCGHSLDYEVQKVCVQKTSGLRTLLAGGLRHPGATPGPLGNSKLFEFPIPVYRIKAVSECALIKHRGSKAIKSP